MIDGHNDALLRARRSCVSLRARSEDGHLDLPRMREGGIAAGFFAIFVPASDERPSDRARRGGADGGRLERLAHRNWLRVLRSAWR